MLALCKSVRAIRCRLSLQWTMECCVYDQASFTNGMGDRVEKRKKRGVRIKFGAR